MHTNRPRWTLLLPLFTLTAMIAGGPKYRLWSALVASVAFTAMQWLVPKCQFRSDQYFSPVNFALLLMLLRLVVGPALIMTVGPESMVLSYLPPLASMEGALLIDTIAYIALCVGLSFTSAASSGSTGFRFPTPAPLLVLLFGAIGIVGFFAEFRSIDGLIRYFLEPPPSAAEQQAQGIWPGVLGIFCRPFFAISLVAGWSRLADNPNRPIWQITAVGFIVSLGIAVANMTFNFNRAAFVFPLICLIAVYHSRIRPIPLSWMASLAAVTLPVLLAISTYRSNLALGNFNVPKPPPQSLGQSISENVQGYAVGPQYTGLFYDRYGWGSQLLGGSSLIASAMSPVPILGKNFRDDSGPAIFNFALYGIGGIEDQILPFNAELFANFHAPGMIIGFIALGFVLGKLEQAVTAASSSFLAFALQYAGIWTAMLATWSLSIFAQIMIYFFGPIYFYTFAVFLRNWLRQQSAPSLKWRAAL